MPTITSYVNEKVWEDGKVTLSFKIDEYVKQKLLEVPLGTYVKITREAGKETLSMWYPKPTE